jgi:hypothetical protein
MCVGFRKFVSVESFLENILNNVSYDLLKWSALAAIPVLLKLIKKNPLALQKCNAYKKNFLGCDLLLVLLKKSPVI